MSTGHKLKLDKRVQIKDGKIIKKTTIFTLKKKRAEDREAASWAKKSPRSKPRAELDGYLIERRF